MKMILQYVSRRYDLNNYKIYDKLSSEVFNNFDRRVFYEVT